ncbi:MAG TPA: PAS domain-containing protein, partial [Burkholderiales bacterium]
MAAAAEPRHSSPRRHAAAAAILAAGVFLCFAAWFLLLGTADRTPGDAAEHQAEQVASGLARALALQAEALRGLGGLVTAAPDLSQSQFQRYVEHQGLRQRFPATEAWGMARMPSAVAGDGAEPAGLRVDHLVPLSAGTFSPGDDLLANPQAGEAFARARRTGALTASARLGDAGQPRVLLLLPLYRNGDARDAAAGRDPAPLGAVFALLRPAELLQLVTAAASADGEVSLVDLAPGGAESLQGGAAPDNAGASVARKLDAGDRQWQIALPRSVSAPPAASLAAWALLALGLAATALLARAAWRREPGLEFREIVAAEGDVVWSSELPGGRLTGMSPSALAFYGHPPERFLENPELWLSLVHTEDRPAVEERLRARDAGQAAAIECRILRADGTERRIRDRAWVIRDATGRPLRIEGVTTDITDSRQEVEELRRLRRAVDQSP